MNKLPLFLFSLSFLVMACHEHASLDQTPFLHFRQEGFINLDIETDWKKLLLGAGEAIYQPAVLSLRKKGCAEEHFHVEVKPRGVFRKQTCDFPPLKIRFPDEVMKAEGLHEHSSLKLVAHCRLDSTYEQLVVKENLVFQLYNVLTDSSFRTQPALIRYVDSGGTVPDFERFGFLIEDADELATRLGGRIIDEGHGTPKHLHKAQYKLFTLFQFMVGNTDWAMKNRHNVKLVEANEGEPKLTIPVPYDFDFCGFVDAPYAAPHHSIPIEDVKERHFQWLGNEGEDFTDEVELFLKKKNELMAVVDESGFLNERSRAECLAYLQTFFEVLEKEAPNLSNKFSETE